MATLFSLILALLWFFKVSQDGAPISPELAGGLVGLTGIALLATRAALRYSFYGILAKKEKTLLSTLPDLIFETFFFRWFFPISLIFPFISITFALLFSTGLSQLAFMLIPAWLLLLGLDTDFFVIGTMKSASYLQFVPLTEHLKRLCLNPPIKKPGQFERGVNGLTEMGLKALDKNSLSGILAVTDALSSIVDEEAARERIQSANPIFHVRMFYLIERLQAFAKLALKEGSLILTSQLFSSQAKVAIRLLQIHPDAARFAIQGMGSEVLEAQNKGLEEAALKGTCTLIETAKAAGRETGELPRGLGSFLAAIVQQLDLIAKNGFRRNKQMPLGPLVEPFRELREYYSHSPYLEFEETPLVLTELDRVLGEFATLGEVLRSIPPVAGNP